MSTHVLNILFTSYNSVLSQHFGVRWRSLSSMASDYSWTESTVWSSQFKLESISILWISRQHRDVSSSIHHVYTNNLSLPFQLEHLVALACQTPRWSVFNMHIKHRQCSFSMLVLHLESKCWLRSPSTGVNWNDKKWLQRFWSVSKFSLLLFDATVKALLSSNSLSQWLTTACSVPIKI